MLTRTPTAPCRARWRWLRIPGPDRPGVLAVTPAVKRPKEQRYEVTRLALPPGNGALLFWLAKLPEGDGYAVRLDGEFSSCDCADFTMGRAHVTTADARPCKHIRALMAAVMALEAGDTEGTVGDGES